MVKIFELDQFSGPLDLLLSLIGEKRLDISEVSLSKVTEQYIEYIEKLERINPEELADFLVIATKLLLIKSRALLPQLMPMEEEEGDSLADQLRLYKEYVSLSREVNRLWQSKKRSYPHIEPVRIIKKFNAPDSLSVEIICQSMLRLLDRLSPPKSLPKTHIDKTVSVKEKIDQIRLMLKKCKSCSFWQMISKKSGKTEVIVGFLAMLELAKQEVVSLRQKALFSDILIKKI